MSLPLFLIYNVDIFFNRVGCILCRFYRVSSFSLNITNCIVGGGWVGWWKWRLYYFFLKKNIWQMFYKCNSPPSPPPLNNLLSVMQAGVRRKTYVKYYKYLPLLDLFNRNAIFSSSTTCLSSVDFICSCLYFIYRRGCVFRELPWFIKSFFFFYNKLLQYKQIKRNWLKRVIISGWNLI